MLQVQYWTEIDFNSQTIEFLKRVCYLPLLGSKEEYSIFMIALSSSNKYVRRVMNFISAHFSVIK